MLGQRISILRRHAGLSQAALARQLHCSPSAVGMYEQGRREPSLEAVVQLSRVFRVSTDFLLTGQPATASDQQLLEAAMMTAVGQTLGRRQTLDRQELEVLLGALLTEA